MRAPPNEAMEAEDIDNLESKQLTAPWAPFIVAPETIQCGIYRYGFSTKISII